MNEYIAQKMKIEKTFRYCLIALAVILIVVIAVSVGNDNMFLYMFSLGYALLVLAIIYFCKFYALAASVRDLRKRGMEHVLNDIDFSKPGLTKSKIYYGKEAMCSGKNGVIIPYSDLAWIYHQEVRARGIVTVAGCYMAFFKNGKSWSFKADNKEFEYLFDKYISRANPGIIVGNGPKQQERYSQIVTVKQWKKKNLRLWGTALISLGVLSLCGMLVLNKDGNSLLAIAAIVAGIIMCVCGIKK